MINIVNFVSPGTDVGRAEKIAIVAVLVIFVVLRFGFPIIYTGTFIDEYFHLAGAVPSFDNGGYDRGRLVTLLVGFLAAVFGKSLYVGKLVPALLGLADFFFFYYLVRRVVRGWWPARPLAMVAFTFSPWIIFNHFYIRMYVLVEFSVLAVLVSSAWAEDALAEGRKVTGYLRLVPAVALTMASVGGDSSGYIALAVFAICSVFLFLAHGFPWPAPQRGLLGWLQRAQTGRALTVGVVAIVVVAITRLPSKILGQVSLELSKLGDTYSSDQLVFTKTFFIENSTLVLLFLIGVVVIFARGSAWQRGLAVASILLFALHNLMSGDQWMMRTALYLFPLLYLHAFAVIALLGSALPRIVVLGFLAMELVVGIPKGFLDGPYLPHEVQYRDYSAAFALMTSHPDASIFTVTGFHRLMPLFYDVDVDFSVGARMTDRESLENILKRFRTAPRPAFLLLDPSGIRVVKGNGLREEFFAAGFTRHRIPSSLVVLER